MNRRHFLQAASAASCASLALRKTFAEELGNEQLFFCAPLTHSDWMLKPLMQWGEPGVRHMLDACKAAGWSRVLWRVGDAGQATYASKLMRPGIKSAEDTIFSPQTDQERAAIKTLLPDLTVARSQDVLRQFTAMDYSKFDSFACAVKYGHEIGLEIHAWLTVNEDDHGWGWQSEFSKKHPELRWVRRDGKPYHSQMSFAFEEVRQYKLGLLQELVDGYALDGLFLDWIRTGDIRDNPQNDPAGVADYGYETPHIERYKSLYGKDPHEVPADDNAWARVRTEGSTQFMRDARKLTTVSGRRIPISTLVGHPWHYRGNRDRIAGNLNGLLLDVNRWANESLVDSVVAAGYFCDGGTPELAFKALTEETVGKLDVWSFAWVQNIAEFNRDFALAKSLGAKQMLFWEADYIDNQPAKTELVQAMKARARW